MLQKSLFVVAIKTMSISINISVIIHTVNMDIFFIILPHLEYIKTRNVSSFSPAPFIYCLFHTRKELLPIFLKPQKCFRRTNYRKCAWVLGTIYKWNAYFRIIRATRKLHSKKVRNIFAFIFIPLLWMVRTEKTLLNFINHFFFLLCICFVARCLCWTTSLSYLSLSFGNFFACQLEPFKH